jgi:HD-like signal output (HDOD) protein
MRGDPSIDDLLPIVKHDEAIVMCILRVANSASYGRSGRIFNLRDAIGRLGSRTMLRIALRQQVGSVLVDGGVSYGLRRGALWRGAIAGAIVADFLARAANFDDPDFAFLCALLRDIGKLVIDRNITHDDLASAALAADGVEEPFVAIERRLFGADHAEIGARLAENWSLPDRIVGAIRHSHEPPAPDDPRHDVVFDLVHAADIVCLWSGIATGHDGLQYALAPHVREAILDSRSRAEAAITTMLTRLTELEAELDQHAPRGRTA